MIRDYILGLGACLNAPNEQLQQAIYHLQPIGDVKALSHCYQTQAQLPDDYSGPKHGLYSNAAIRIISDLSPSMLLLKTQHIELMMGRAQHEKGLLLPRVIDIDILLADQAIIQLPALTIPHPYFWHRAFAVFPAADLWPEWCHPLFRHSLRTRKEQLSQQHSFPHQQALTLTKPHVTVH